MADLTNPVTGHQIKTDDESVEFWTTAGYRVAKTEPKKAPAKKAASSSKSKK